MLEPGQIVGPGFWRARFILREPVEAASLTGCPIWLVDEIGGKQNRLRICLSRAEQQVIVPRRVHNLAALAKPGGILDGIRDPFFGPVPQRSDALPPEGQLCADGGDAYYLPLSIAPGLSLRQLLTQGKEQMSLLACRQDTDASLTPMLADPLALPLAMSWPLLGPVIWDVHDLLALLQGQSEALVHGGLTADSVRFWNEHPWEEGRLLAAEPACCLPPELAPSDNTGDVLDWVDLISLILFDEPRGTDPAVIDAQANRLADRAQLTGDPEGAEAVASAWRDLAVNDLPYELSEFVRTAAAAQREAVAYDIRLRFQELLGSSLTALRERAPVSRDALLSAVVDATFERARYSLDELLFHYQHRLSRTWLSEEPPDIWAGRWTDPEYLNFRDLVDAGLMYEAARFASPYLDPVARTIAITFMRLVFTASQPGWEPNWEQEPLHDWAPAADRDLRGEPLKQRKVRWRQAVDQQDIEGVISMGLELLCGGALSRLKT